MKKKDKYAIYLLEKYADKLIRVHLENYSYFSDEKMADKTSEQIEEDAFYLFWEYVEIEALILNREKKVKKGNERERHKQVS